MYLFSISILLLSFAGPQSAPPTNFEPVHQANLIYNRFDSLSPSPQFNRPPEEPLPTNSPPGALGEALFEARCVSCHGAENLTLVSPILNGLPSGYIAKQLNRFRMGIRKDFLMAGAMNEVTQSLSDQEIENLSEYLGNSDACQIPSTAVDPQGGRVELGAELFSSNACLACHNDESQSIRPLLRGQRTLYLAQQLMAFRDKDRPDFTMSRIASDLSDEEILDLSAYINSLTGCPEPTP